jgi:NAD(P)-dependent dehydrogenase (short-subunit alcohol dehydrogenase family)
MTTRTVLISGANRGLGLEFARQYLADGWQVLATMRRDSPALAALREQSPRRLQCHQLDVTDYPAIERLSVLLADTSIDVLINNAGYLGKVPFASGGVDAQAFGRMDYADWELTFRINVLGPMKLAEAFVEQVARSSERKIVTLTSMLGCMGLNASGGLYGYRSTKAAVNSIMHSMSIDLRNRGILAVAVHPGWAQTDMGGAGADLDVAESVRGVRQLIAGLTTSQLGRVHAWNGEILPY